MQSFFKRLIPSKLKSLENTSNSDLKGFVLADSLEGGVAREGVSDFMQPMKESALYLIRKGSAKNEWIVSDYRSPSFIMRAVVELEKDGQFQCEFDPVSVQKSSGRVRVALYLSEAENGLDPAVLMISSADRVEWTALKTHCDVCRYRRRRSSFTEGQVEDDSPRSACSYVCTDSVHFADLCMPSGQEILRMRHVQMSLGQCAFTKLTLSIPGASWCPAVPLGSDSASICMTSASPIYSEKLKALALEFRQRSVLPSRRNFQLQEGATNSVLVQHYRSGKNEYTLEVSAPLSLVQAFCIALSTLLWQ